MKYLLLALLCIFLFSCEDDDSTLSACSNDVEIDITRCYSPLSDFNETEDAYYDVVVGQIEFDTATNTGYAIREGSNIVFVYRNIFGLFNLRVDDEREERLFFEIDNSLESFVIDSEAEFEASNCTYGLCSAWIPDLMFQSFEGSISGNRISGCEWNIDCDVIAESWNGSRDTFQFNEVFRN